MVLGGHDDLLICVQDEVFPVVVFDHMGMDHRRKVDVHRIKVRAKAHGRDLLVNPAGRWAGRRAVRTPYSLRWMSSRPRRSRSFWTARAMSHCPSVLGTFVPPLAQLWEGMAT